jgi:hypothetical protein
LKLSEAEFWYDSTFGEIAKAWELKVSWEKGEELPDKIDSTEAANRRERLLKAHAARTANHGE